jgi:uncharacterized protein
MFATAPGLFCIAFAASTLGSALGMASGIFIVPLLTLVAGMNIHAAIGASIVSVIACSCASASTLLRERLTNVRLAIVLEVATTLGAACGALLIGTLPVKMLYGIFVVVLLVSAWQMLTPRQVVCDIDDTSKKPRWARRLDSSYPDRALGQDVLYQVARLPQALGLMYCAGLLSALLGIGSGVLKIPAMDTALRLPLKVSSATSNFMIGVTAAASACAFFRRGIIIPAIAAPVALGSVLGAILGARLLRVVPAAKLRIVFVAMLLFLALQMSLATIGVYQH